MIKVGWLIAINSIELISMVSLIIGIPFNINKEI